jgi:hypothetical protein
MLAKNADGSNAIDPITMNVIPREAAVELGSKYYDARALVKMPEIFVPHTRRSLTNDEKEAVQAAIDASVAAVIRGGIVVDRETVEAIREAVDEVDEMTTAAQMARETGGFFPDGNDKKIVEIPGGIAVGADDRSIFVQFRDLSIARIPDAAPFVDVEATTANTIRDWRKIARFWATMRLVAKLPVRVVARRATFERAIADAINGGN